MIAGIIGTIVEKVAGVFGKTLVDLHGSETTRQVSQQVEGGKVAGQWIEGHTAAGAQRADVQKTQGTWGPFGLAGAVIAFAFAYHVVLVVFDSTPWHIVPTTRLGVIPWLEWSKHVVGSWGVERLPGKFEDTEHEILKALFYVGPPSAAAVIVARAFRK